MKYLIISVISLLFLTSCEEVIDLELDSVEPRLVIDAALERRINSDGVVIEFNQVLLSLTTDVFDSILLVFLKMVGLKFKMMWNIN